MKSWVRAGEYGWVSTEIVDFIDIEESPFGDRMYFNYNGEDYSSLIVLGYSRPIS